MSYWLFKTEPDEFGIQDLAQAKNKRENWNGVRNYQARNFLRDDVAVGDLVFIYHSSCKLVGIAGLAKVSQTGLIDPSQFDPQSAYFDPKSTQDKPRWFMVEVEHVETFEHVLALKDIKNMPDIAHIGLVQKGHRLSIMPVQEGEFALLLERARRS
jgi:predicted RNA-binding protein with PUA-like domain